MQSPKAWYSELDPDGTHGQAKLRAALNYSGLVPADLDPAFPEKGAPVHEKTPKDKSPSITQQRREIREQLRRSRVNKVREVLGSMDEDDVRRFGLAGGGVRPLKASDVPAMDAVDGVEEIQAFEQQQMEKIQKAAERKGNAICTDFLTSKKKADDADAKVAGLAARLKEFRKEQDVANKARKVELQKALEKRTSAVNKAAAGRSTWEDEVESKAAEKLKGARDRRAQKYSPAGLQSKLEAAEAKRESAFNQAVENEEQTLARIQDRAAAVDAALAQNRQERAEYLEDRRQKSREEFLQKQINVAALFAKKEADRQQAHSDFNTKFGESRARGDLERKTRSKSTGDIARKARDKAMNNLTKVNSEIGTKHEELLARHMASTQRVEDYTKPMKFKCGNDVFSCTEVKYKTWGDLQQRRYQEVKAAEEAKGQALCLEIAERQAKWAAKDAADAAVKRKRTEAAKNNLKYANDAEEVFLKIQSEPNEARIRTAMEGLGFKMAKLEEKGKEEEAA